MHTSESSDDFFVDDWDATLADDSPDAPEGASAGSDLFNELPHCTTATEDLHGEFEGDLRAGVMARIATGGAIKE
jgi:hypothetical protein